MNYKDIKNYLFNINIINNNENDINELKNKIINAINKDKNDINITYINSKIAQNYLKYNNLFTEDYKNLFDNILKLYYNKGIKNCFSEFFLYNIKLYMNELFESNEINNEENYNDIYEKINNLFENYYPDNTKEENLSTNIQNISSYLSYIKKNIKKGNYYKESFIDIFYKDLLNSINSAINLKMQNLLNIFNSCTNNFKSFFKYDEEYRILNYTKNFDSFFALFQGYKANNFSLPNEIIELKKSVDNRSDYYKLKKEVRNYAHKNTHGTSDEINWTNGILNESENPKVYMKKFEKKCDGKAFQKVTINFDENFKDIIIGWRIESKWEDGTNGEWFMDENPLLTNKFKCKFVSQFFRGQRFNVYIYFMKYPN